MNVITDFILDNIEMLPGILILGILLIVFILAYISKIIENK